MWLTFSLFFAQINLGAQIEALESFTKREIPQRYKFELWNNKRYITVTLRGVLEREREQEEELFTRERLVALKCRERANNNLNNHQGVPE